MPPRFPSSGITTAGRRPELPAFCRTRAQRTISVSDSKLRRLERLLWLVLLFQLSTLLLVIDRQVGG